MMISMRMASDQACVSPRRSSIARTASAGFRLPTPQLVVISASARGAPPSPAIRSSKPSAGMSITKRLKYSERDRASIPCNTRSLPGSTFIVRG